MCRKGDNRNIKAKEAKPSAVLKLEKTNFDTEIQEGVVFVKVRTTFVVIHLGDGY
jgi:hypothetical protein